MEYCLNCRKKRVYAPCGWCARNLRICDQESEIEKLSKLCVRCDGWLTANGKNIVRCPIHTEYCDWCDMYYPGDFKRQVRFKENSVKFHGCANCYKQIKTGFFALMIRANRLGIKFPKDISRMLSLYIFQSFSPKTSQDMRPTEKSKAQK